MRPVAANGEDKLQHRGRFEPYSGSAFSSARNLNMSIVTAALRAMERIAPLRLAGSWDNVGLIVGTICVSTAPPAHSMLNDLERLRQLRLFCWM